jgi:hypothetical protein
MPVVAEQFRMWAESARKWASETPDPKVAAEFRQLADNLERLAGEREQAISVKQDPPQTARLEERSSLRFGG